MESLHIRLTGRYIPGTGPPPVAAPAPLQQPNMRRKQPQIGVLRKPSRPPDQPRRKSKMEVIPAMVTAAPPPPPPPPPPPTENTVPEVVFEDETM